MTSKSEIRGWLEEGKRTGATHVIIACDTYDHEDYPVYIKVDEDVRMKEAELRNQEMTKVMEVYSMSMDIERQLAQHRAFNYA